eukprot:TRINITY_DN14100_c0_g1_i3.p1 TRINITY_DN14100_c0_g1~~TRINITY_DN14100_c0_g1_i3.p1  ORF type:complete len:563 (-),score=148.80 TRINITY_DN14100_c0_g1_i3:173-1624(-)
MEQINMATGMSRELRRRRKTSAGARDDSDSEEADEDDEDDEDDSVRYEVELDSGWVGFDAPTARKLAAAQRKGKATVGYSARYQNYVVDFAAMTQTNRRTKVSRAIRRIDENEEPEAVEEEDLDALPGLRALHDLLYEPAPEARARPAEPTRLSAAEIRETIVGLVPEAAEWIAPRSSGTLAIDFLIRSYYSGLPAFPEGVSSHLAAGVRTIVAAVKQPDQYGISSERARCVARQLAEVYTNCQAVQARTIDALQAELLGVSSHSLSAQLRAFVEEHREMALDRTVCHFHPNAPLQDDSNPTEQLPHLSNRYRRCFGEEVGLGGARLVMANADRNAQLRLPVSRKKALSYFKREFRAREVVGALVADVNQADLEAPRRVSPTLLMRWAGEEASVRHRIFYDEETPEVYGNFSPSPSQRDGQQPVLHEGLAVELLLSVLGAKALAEEIRALRAKLEAEGLSGYKINEHEDLKRLAEQLQEHLSA